MTNPENVKLIIESLTEDLKDPKIFDEASIIASHSSNQQMRVLCDMERTNQYLIGHLIFVVKEISKDLRVMKESILLLNKESEDSQKAIQNTQKDIENLSRNLKDIDISKDIQNLNQSLDKAKAVSQDKLQPDFGWSRRNKVNWLNQKDESSS